MITSPSFTGLDSFLSDDFRRLRRRARRAWLLARIFGKRNGLKSLASPLSLDRHNRRYIGLQTIAVDSITGTLGRNADFDGDFRPLQDHLRDRWVRAFLLLESDGWAPVVLHKLGDDYYVEDGHHRVSVAKFAGRMAIEAEVWDHTSATHKACVPQAPALRRKEAVCACAAD